MMTLFSTEFLYPSGFSPPPPAGCAACKSLNCRDSALICSPCCFNCCCNCAFCSRNCLTSFTRFVSSARADTVAFRRNPATKIPWERRGRMGRRRSMVLVKQFGIAASRKRLPHSRQNGSQNSFLSPFFRRGCFLVVYFPRKFESTHPDPRHALRPRLPHRRGIEE